MHVQATGEKTVHERKQFGIRRLCFSTVLFLFRSRSLRPESYARMLSSEEFLIVAVKIAITKYMPTGTRLNGNFSAHDHLGKIVYCYVTCIGDHFPLEK